MLDGDGRQRRERLGLAQHALRDVRVQPDALPLAGAERAGLVPDRVRDAEPAEVVRPGRRGGGFARRPRRARAARRPRRPGPPRRASGRGSRATSGPRSSPWRAARRRSARPRRTTARAGSASMTASQAPTPSSPDRITSASASTRSRHRGVELPAAPARAPAPAPPPRRRPGSPPRGTRRPRRCRAARGTSSPSRSPGQPRPSQRSYAAPSAVDHLAGQLELLAERAGDRGVVLDHAVHLAMARERELEPEPEAVERRVARAEEAHAGRGHPEAARVVVVLDRLHRRCRRRTTSPARGRPSGSPR